MVAVVVIAVCLSAATLWLRQDRLRRLAEAYHLEANAEYVASTLIFQRHHHGPSVPEQKMMDAHERRGAYYERLSEKYRTAARRPWLRTGPDSPAPAWPADAHL
jgi:hypothetical protein